MANAKDSSISVFRVVEQKLVRLSVADGLEACSNFVVDEVRDLVYAAVKGQPAGIVTLRLDREAGTLTPAGRRDTPRGGLNYVSLTRDGSAILGASFAGGYGIICPIRGGVVGEPVSEVEYPNLHSAIASGDGRFAYFVSLGADLIGQYSIGDDLRLTDLGAAPAPGGSGPRHPALNESQDALYVLTEFTAEVLRYHRDTDTGLLDFVDSVTAYDTDQGLVPGKLGADPLERHAIWGADLHWGAGEHYLWTSERSVSTLGALQIAEDGSACPPQQFTVTEQQPRGFALSADGAFLVAAGERSTAVSLYSVEADRLTLLDRAETGNGANWVRFV